MLVEAYNLKTWREEEWPIRITILENTFPDANSSYQLSLKKNKKPWYVHSYGSYGSLGLQLSSWVFLFPARTGNTLTHCHILLPVVASRVLLSVIS